MADTVNLRKAMLVQKIPAKTEDHVVKVLTVHPSSVYADLVTAAISVKHLPILAGPILAFMVVSVSVSNRVTVAAVPTADTEDTAKNPRMVSTSYPT